MPKIQADQKVNQNILSMVTGCAFIWLYEYFNLPSVVYWTGFVVMLASAVSVRAILIPYTVNYWKKKYKNFKNNNLKHPGEI